MCIQHEALFKRKNFCIHDISFINQLLVFVDSHLRMPDNVELVTFTSEEQENENTKAIPVTHRNMHTVNEFKEYFINLPAFIFIVLVFFNPSNKILHPILKEIKKRKIQIIRIIIYGNFNDNQTNNSMNIPSVSQLLLLYKIKSTIARFLDKECIKQCNLGHKKLGVALREQRTQILEKFDENDKVSADFWNTC
jgi:hypothetical protein